MRQHSDLPVHPMRPSKAAAYGLLARVYLSMKKYDSAYLYADQALQLKDELMDFNGDNDIYHRTLAFIVERFLASLICS